MRLISLRSAISAPLLVLILALPGIAAASDCDNPQNNWLFCEDFESGDLGWQGWFDQSPFVECLGCSEGMNNPDRIRLTNAPDDVRDGNWALSMPGSGPDHLGASLTWRNCDGEKRPGCTLTNLDRIYWRAWVKLAPEHRYVHHFMSIAGTQPDQYWGADGNAGCRPNGERAAGTTVDFNFDDNRGEHGLFFYTYFPDMNCDSGGYCSGDYVQNICSGCADKDMPCTNGPECCWGNHFAPDPRPVLPRGEWVCLEMMMELNTPGQSDGEMAFWVNDQLGHREQGMEWRTVPGLGLNKVWVQHYIAPGDTDQANPIVWDDIVASRGRIGCGEPPDPPADEPPADDPPVEDMSTGDTATDTGSDTPSNDVTDDVTADDVPEDDGSDEDEGTDTDETMFVEGDLGGDTGCGCRLSPSERLPLGTLILLGLAAGAILLSRRRFGLR